MSYLGSICAFLDLKFSGSDTVQPLFPLAFFYCHISHTCRGYISVYIVVDSFSIIFLVIRPSLTFIGLPSDSLVEEP